MFYKQLIGVITDTDTEVRILEGYRCITAIPDPVTPQAMAEARNVLYEFLGGRYGDVELACDYHVSERNGYWAAVAVEEPAFTPRYKALKPQALIEEDTWLY